MRGVKVYEMSEENKKYYPKLDIKKDGTAYQLYLNGTESKTVPSFNLQVNVGKLSNLTIIMDID